VLAYVDSSALLRVIFGERDALPQFRELTYGIASEILKVECLRTIDRMRLSLPLPDEEISSRRALVFQALRKMEVIPLGPAVLERAAQPFPTTLGTLDAIHLSSALLWQESEGRALALLTHDRELGLGAKACGLSVHGC